MSKNFKGTSVTTGSIATATSLAALKLILNNEPIDQVTIHTPNKKLDIIIDKCKKLGPNKAKAISHKFPYNDPDVTVNLDIISTVELTDFKDQEIIIKGGEGVGTVTKRGLQIEINKPAINPTPKKMIKDNLKPLIPKNKTAIITISVPQGQKIAKKTMNPKLGIINGISILGTTGIARSMSSKAYKSSITKQIDIAIASGIKNPIFVPGNIGEKLAIKIFNINKSHIIQTGNYIGFMLEEAKKKGYHNLTLFGNIGKLIKIAGGIFNTKHTIADGRKEIMITHAALCSASTNTIKKIYNSKTTEEMLEILNNNNLKLDVCNNIANSIIQICKNRFNLNLNVILVDINGNLLNNNFQPL